MKPKFYAVLTEAIERGVGNGIHRAFKHNATPGEDVIQAAVEDAVMSALHEWFEFEEIGNGSDVDQRTL